MSIIQEMPQKIHSGSNRYFFWLDLILLFLLAGYVLSGINLVPFHGDEATFIVMSEDYDRIVKHRDVSRVLFNAEGSLKQNTRLSTGSILALSIGFARDITDTEESTSRWLWGASWDENISQGNMPDPEILRLARAFPAAMGALSIVLFFFTTLYLFPSRLFAWASTLTLVTHGDVLMSFRRAIQEGPKFFFLILTLYMASHMLKDLQNRNIRRYPYIFLGLASGLTLAAKQDTAPVLLAIFIALSLIPIWKRDPLRIKLINMVFLGTSAILALSCFLLLMPVFWSWWESALALIGLVIILFQLPLWKTDRAARPLALAGCLLVLAMTAHLPHNGVHF